MPIIFINLLTLLIQTFVYSHTILRYFVKILLSRIIKLTLYLKLIIPSQRTKFKFIQLYMNKNKIITLKISVYFYNKFYITTLILLLLLLNIEYVYSNNKSPNDIFLQNRELKAEESLSPDLQKIENNLKESFEELKHPSITQHNIDISLLSQQISSYEEQQFNQAYQYYKEAIAFLEQKRKALGEDKFFEELKKDLIVYKINSSTQVRFGLTGKNILVNLLTNDGKLSTLFIDLDKITQEDPFLQRYIAKQKLNFGNNVLIIKEQGGELVGAEYMPHPTFFSAQWWRDFIKSVWVKPQKGDVVLGALCGIYQGSLTICLNLAKNLLAEQGPIDVMTTIAASQSAALMTTIFATTIGTFCSLYRNLIYVGPKYQRILKSSIISLAFAYSFFLLTNSQGIQGLDPTTTTGLLNNLHVGINVFLTQYARDDWVQIVRARAQLKSAQGNLKIGIIDTGIPKANAELQAVYNFIQFPLKILDLINFKIFGIPIGKLVFYASVPFIRKFNQIWFENKYIELCNKYKLNPTPELEEHLTKFKTRLEEIELAWEKLLTIGIYTTLPIMKILQKQFYEEKLHKLQTEYEQTQSPKLEIQIHKLQRKIAIIDKTWNTLIQKTYNNTINVFQKSMYNIRTLTYKTCQMIFKFFSESK